MRLQDNGGTANGGVDTSAAQTFVINVTAVNDVPSFTKGADQTANEGDGGQNVANWATNISRGSADEAGQTLNFLVTTNNDALFLVVPTISDSGTLTYTPGTNANGIATVTVRLQDNGGTANGGQDTSPAQTFTITIIGVNDAPVLDNTGNMALAAILEDAVNNTGTLVTDLIASAGGDRITDEDSGALEGIAVTAADVANGAWEYSTNDGGTWSALGAVSGTNSRLLSADTQTRLRFVPNLNFNGSIANAITFRAWDRTTGANGGTADSSINGGTTAFSTATETASIAVTAVNDLPSFSKGTDQTVLEDAGAQTTAGWATNISAGPADEAAQTLTFVVTTNNDALFSVLPAINASNGSLTFRPAANANGSATITVRLQDNGGTANGGVDTSAAQTFTIGVTAVNDVPTFTKGSDQTVLEDVGAQMVTGWATNISRGPADEAGQTLTFLVTTNNDALFSVLPAVNSSNGNLTYTPAANANGSATITVRLQDNGGTANGGLDTSAAQTFVINVTAVNDVPSFTKGADQTAPEDSGRSL